MDRVPDPSDAQSRWASSTVDEFRDYLAKGLGRTHLILEEDRSGVYADAVVEACLLNEPYDYQCEGSRAQYLYELSELAGCTDRVVSALIQALDGDDDDHIDHRFEMAGLLAREGKPGVLEAMRAAFERLIDRWPTTDRNSWPADSLAESLISVGNLDGALFAFGQLGRLALADPQYQDDDYLLSEARSAIGESNLDEALAGARTTDPRMDAYLKAVEKERPTHADSARPRHPLERMPWSDAQQAIERQVRGTGQTGFGWHQWGSRASDRDLELAAHALVDLPKDDVELLRAYLRVFFRRAFPLDPRPLIVLIGDPRDKVAWFAANALERVEHPAVREAALRMADRGPLQERAVDLLAANWEPGDERIVERLLQSECDRDRLHALGLGLLDVIEAHPLPALIPSLLLGYERTPCSLCRGGFVDALLSLDGLPDELRGECRWDTDQEIRDAVAH
jgi:hypothetical protein